LDSARQTQLFSTRGEKRYCRILAALPTGKRKWFQKNALQPVVRHLTVLSSFVPHHRVGTRRSTDRRLPSYRARESSSQHIWIILYFASTVLFFSCSIFYLANYRTEMPLTSHRCDGLSRGVHSRISKFD